MTIPQAVKELRTLFGESQQTFSNRLGLTVTSISRYENGTNPPDMNPRIEMWKLAREHGREDLARVFMFGTDQTREFKPVEMVLLDELDGQFLSPAERHARQLELIVPKIIAGELLSPAEISIIKRDFFSLAADLRGAREFVRERRGEV